LETGSKKPENLGRIHLDQEGKRTANDSASDAAGKRGEDRALFPRGFGGTLDRAVRIMAKVQRDALDAPQSPSIVAFPIAHGRSARALAPLGRTAELKVFLSARQRRPGLLMLAPDARNASSLADQRLALSRCPCRALVQRFLRDGAVARAHPGLVTLIPAPRVLTLPVCPS